MFQMITTQMAAWAAVEDAVEEEVGQAKIKAITLLKNFVVISNYLSVLIRTVKEYTVLLKETTWREN